MPRAPAALIAALMLTLPAPLAAEERAAPGVLNAFVCAPIQKAGLRLDLRPTDDAPEIARLTEAARRALGAEGIELTPEAPARVTVMMQVIRERALANPDTLRLVVRPPVSFHDAPRTTAGAEPAAPQRVPPEPHGELLDQVRVTLEIHDKATGRCLWHGAARYALERREPWLVAEPLVDVVAAAIGSTSRARGFDLELPPPPLPGLTPPRPRPAG